MITSISESTKLKKLGLIYPTKLLYNVKAYKLLPYNDILKDYLIKDCVSAFNAQELLNCFPKKIKQNKLIFTLTCPSNFDGTISYISIDNKQEIYFLLNAFANKSKIDYIFETLVRVLEDIQNKVIECI